MNGYYCDQGKDVEIPGDQIEQNFKNKNEEIKKGEWVQRSISLTQYLRRATKITQQTTLMESGESNIIGLFFQLWTAIKLLPT